MGSCSRSLTIFFLLWTLFLELFAKKRLVFVTATGIRPSAQVQVLNAPTSWRGGEAGAVTYFILIAHGPAYTL